MLQDGQLSSHAHQLSIEFSSASDGLSTTAFYHHTHTSPFSDFAVGYAGISLTVETRKTHPLPVRGNCNHRVIHKCIHPAVVFSHPARVENPSFAMIDLFLAFVLLARIVVAA